MRISTMMIATGLFVTAFPAMAQDKPAMDRNDPNATRCKRIAVTGSLVRKDRICKTNAEWRAISEQQNRDADDMITRSRSGMNPNG